MSDRSAADAPLLIHVGYHKTGTTWLQRVLFQPAYGWNPIMSHEEVFDLIVRPLGLTFDPQPVRDLIAQRAGRGAPGSVDVISSEILVGNPMYGGREGDDYARRLKAIAPNAKILITIREQMRSLTSIYMQYLSRGGSMKPDRFFADEPVIGYYAFGPEHLDYHRLVGLYAELFGLENVHVTTQERLAKDPLGLIRDLDAFAGVTAAGDLDNISTDPVTPSQQEFATPLIRFINHFRAGPTGLDPMFDLGGLSRLAYQAVGRLGRQAPVKALFGKAQPVSKVVARRFAGRYRESNRALKALMGDRLDLSRYES
jgi:hypothetical protein